MFKNLYKTHSFKDLFKLDILTVTPTSTPVTISTICNKTLDNGKRKRTCIATLYLPLVKYLRIIGFCPFTIIQDYYTKSAQYEVHWCSVPMIYYIFNTVFFTLMSLGFVVALLWHGLKTDFKELLKFQGILHENHSEIHYVPEFGTRLVPATFPFFSVTASLGIISSMPCFLKLLQQWPEFQTMYFHTFPHRVDDPFIALQKYRNTTFILFPIVGLIAVGTVFFIMYECEIWGGCIFPKGLICFPTVWSTLTMMIAAGSHSTHFLMLRTLREVYTQIFVGIKTWNENEINFHHISSNYRRRLNANIKNWSEIMTMAKAQVHLTGKAISFYQIFMILVNFSYLCLGVFATFLSPKVGTGHINRGYILLMFCGWGFGLLVVKAFVCETIVAEERLVVDELRKVDVKEYLPGLVKIHGLINMINDNPAEIRFLNVITFNKSFILQLFGQVATYLIVLIQFENLHRSNA